MQVRVWVGTCVCVDGVGDCVWIGVDVRAYVRACVRAWVDL